MVQPRRSLARVALTLAALLTEHAIPVMIRRTDEDTSTIDLQFSNDMDANLAADALLPPGDMRTHCIISQEMINGDLLRLEIG